MQTTTQTNRPIRLRYLDEAYRHHNSVPVFARYARTGAFTGSAARRQEIDEEIMHHLELLLETWATCRALVVELDDARDVVADRMNARARRIARSAR